MSTHALPQPPMFDGSQPPSQPPPPQHPNAGVTASAPNTQPVATPAAYVDREPVVTAATIIGVLSAIISWAVARNYVGEAENALLMAIVPTIGAIGFAYYGRRGVTSVGRAQIAIDDAYTAQPGLDPKPQL